MRVNKWFVILGGNKLLRGVYDRLKEFGYSVVVVDWNESPALLGDVHIQLDVKDTDSVLRVLRNHGYDIDGAFSSIDLAVPTINAINQYYGLKTMPQKFNKVLSKKQMKLDWENAGLFNRFSKDIKETSLGDIVKQNAITKLIIKPDVAASSRGITVLPVNSSHDTIIEAISKAVVESNNKNCLVEEFVEGREFTVDMLGDDYGNVVVYGISVKYHSHYAKNNRVAVKLHWNSDAYPLEEYKRIADCGRECYKALGLKNSYGHLEMIMKKDGTLTPVEIGARTSGFIGSHLVPAASDKDYLFDYIRMLHGANIGSIDHLGGKNSSMWYKYNIPNGYICKNEVSLPAYLNDNIKVMYFDREGLKKDMRYDAIVDDNSCDREGYEMMLGPKEVLTIDYIRQIESLFLKDFCDYDKPLPEED